MVYADDFISMYKVVSASIALYNVRYGYMMLKGVTGSTNHIVTRYQFKLVVL